MAAPEVDLLRQWILSGQSAWLRVRGDSMHPFLPDGSRVLVAGESPRSIDRGDLLVHQADGRFVCHRVVRRILRERGWSFLTTGDNRRWTFASWISGHDVIGTVIAVERNGECVRLDTPRHRREARSLARRSLIIRRLRAPLTLARRMRMRLARWMESR